MFELSEEQIADLIAALPPAPEGWAQAAIELPAAKAAIDSLVADAIEDQRRREAVLSDLEAALREVGVEPRARFLAEVRTRLSEP